MISILLYTYPGAHRVRFGPGKTFYLYIYTFQTTFLVRQFGHVICIGKQTKEEVASRSCFFREISFVTLLFSTALFKKLLQSWRTRDNNNKRVKETEFKRDASKAFNKDVVVE